MSAFTCPVCKTRQQINGRVVCSSCGWPDNQPVATAKKAKVSAPKSITEKAFQQQVVDLARSLGWLCYHTYDSRRCEPGFPDLVLTNQHRVVFAELKSEKGRLQSEQEMWLSWLRIADQEVYIWRPSDLESIKQILRQGGKQ